MILFRGVDFVSKLSMSANLVQYRENVGLFNSRNFVFKTEYNTRFYKINARNFSTLLVFQLVSFIFSAFFKFQSHSFVFNSSIFLSALVAICHC